MNFNIKNLIILVSDNKLKKILKMLIFKFLLLNKIIINKFIKYKINIEKVQLNNKKKLIIQ